MTLQLAPVLIFFGVAATCFVVLLVNTIIYFRKDRPRDLANGIFNIIIIAGLCSILLDLGCHIAVQNWDSGYLFSNIIPKTYIISILLFSCLMTLYVVAIDSTKPVVKKRLAVKHWAICLAVFLICIMTTSIFVEINAYYDGILGYTYGFLVDTIMLPFLGFMMAYWLYITVKNLHRHSREVRRRFAPVILFLILYSTTAILQGVFGKWILITSLIMTIIIIVAMNTIENPELKIIKTLNILDGKLKRADKAKDEFMSLASHQLRTPLTSIHGYSSMLMDGDFGELNDKQKYAMSEVMGSAERMAFLVSDLLNVSRLQSGKFMIEIEEADLKEMAEKEVDSLRVLADSHDVKLVLLKMAKNLPTLMIDSKKVSEVMANMIDNAIFYSSAGSTVEISVVKNKDFLEFRVKDHGIGVPKSEQDDLFTKFFRASNARTKRPDGTGIGLFLARKVIVEQGGEIILHSVEGEGSTFGFRLPIPPNPAKQQSPE
jgi:signal transduction histidine kinase